MAVCAPPDTVTGVPAMFLAHLTRRSGWPAQLGVAVTSMGCALVLTHALWRPLQHMPFMLGFAAATLSSRVGGRRAGLLSVVFGALIDGWFPPPLPPEGMTAFLAGFVVISGTFSWLVARRYEIEADLRSSEERLRAVILEPAHRAVGDERRRAGHGRRGYRPRRARRQTARPARTVRVRLGTKRSPSFWATHAARSPAKRSTQWSRSATWWSRMWYSPVRDHQGVVTGAMGVSVDVTKRRRLEEQYVHAQKMEAVGRLAAGIAHDFNNVLTAVGGYTEFVTRTLAADDARRHDLEEVSRAAQRATALTRQLLAFSRRQILRPTVLDVNTLISDVEKLLRRAIPEHVVLHLDLRPIAPVRADRGQLEQVLLNLAINAGHAMPDGGELRVATHVVERDGAGGCSDLPMAVAQCVRVTVSDTGIGMTAETQARIFEPFFTTKERGEGTGLGLATVSGIVGAEWRTIQVSSQPGRRHDLHDSICRPWMRR